MSIKANRHLQQSVPNSFPKGQGYESPINRFPIASLILFIDYDITAPHEQPLKLQG